MATSIVDLEHVSGNLVITHDVQSAKTLTIVHSGQFFSVSAICGTKLQRIASWTSTFHRGHVFLYTCPVHFPFFFLLQPWRAEDIIEALTFFSAWLNYLGGFCIVIYWMKTNWEWKNYEIMLDVGDHASEVDPRFVVMVDCLV